MLRVIAACLVLAGAGLAEAATFPDLYAIIVPRVAGSGPDARARSQDETVRFAMTQLLTRVTGRRDAAFEPRLGGLIEQARDFVEQIGPVDRDNLIVRFNATNVENALVRLDQPVWGPERPLTLVWIAVDAGLGQRELLSAESQIDSALQQSDLTAQLDAIRDELAQLADERGLLLALPLLDIEDLTALGFADVWGGFNDRIERASQRYAPDDVLVGQLRLTSFGPSARWTLLRGGRQIAVPGQTVREGLDGLADIYAAEFSTLGRASTAVLTIDGVDSLEAYGRVMRYLESLSMLEAIAPDALEHGSLRVRVEVRGGESALRRVFGLGELLEPAPGPDVLTYTLRP
jgi:hypothetical protein